MQHNYRRGLELSAFQILTEVIGGNLSGFLNKFLKLHFINKLHWTSHSWKKKPGNSQHCFISLFFLALNIFSVIPFLKYNTKLLLYVSSYASCSGGCHPSQASTHSFPAAHSALCPAYPEHLAVPLHSTGILHFTQAQWLSTHLFHLWCHSARLFQHHISYLPGDFIF